MADTLVKRNANVNDTIKLILNRINSDVNSDFVKKLAIALNPEGDKLEYIKRVFDYVDRNVKYKLDEPEKEDVYKPSTTIKNGRGDCKKMTVLIASVLKAAGIEPLIKHVYYNGENFTHVYVIVPYPNLSNYIVVDPVNDHLFNKEVIYSSANIFDLKGNRMDLYTGNKPSTKTKPTFKDHINMMACAVDNEMGAIMQTGQNNNVAVLNQIFDEAEISMSGVGKRKKKTKEERKKARQELLKKVTKVVKKVGAAPMRGAFLTLVRINKLPLAKKLALAWGKDKAAIEGFWTGFGGKVPELKAAIIAGSGNKISGVSTGQGVAAIIATATPILIAVLTKLRQLGVVREGDATDDLIEDAIGDATDDVNDGTIPEDELAKQQPDGGSPNIRDIKLVVTKAPTQQTRALMNNGDAAPDDGGGGSPTHGSFFSAWGMCWWGMMMTGRIQNEYLMGSPLLMAISSLIALYFLVGFLFFGWIYQMDLPWKKYIAWYFDIPKAAFSTIYNSITNFSFKKRYHESY